jgi:hypothetical protein
MGFDHHAGGRLKALGDQMTIAQETFAGALGTVDDHGAVFALLNGDVVAAFLTIHFPDRICHFRLLLEPPYPRKKSAKDSVTAVAKAPTGIIARAAEGGGYNRSATWRPRFKA